MSLPFEIKVLVQIIFLFSVFHKQNSMKRECIVSRVSLTSALNPENVGPPVCDNHRKTSLCHFATTG